MTPTFFFRIILLDIKYEKKKSVTIVILSKPMRDDHKINVVYKLIYIAELEKEKKGKKGTSLENRANIPHSYSKNLNTRTVLFWCFNLCIKLFQTIHFSWWNFSTNSLHFFSNFPMKSLQKKTETLFTKVNHFCWWLQWKCIHFSNDIVKKLIHFEFLIKKFHNREKCWNMTLS